MWQRDDWPLWMFVGLACTAVWLSMVAAVLTALFIYLNVIH